MFRADTDFFSLLQGVGLKRMKFGFYLFYLEKHVHLSPDSRNLLEPTGSLGTIRGAFSIV
jgi:hypothetical protein